MTSAHEAGPDPIPGSYYPPGTYPGAQYDPGTSGSAAMTTAAFAGTMLLIVGAFQVLQGIAALASNTVYVSGVEYVYKLDMTSWGWIHIVIGAIAVATGIGVLAAQKWAYFVGIILAVVASFTNFAFIPYYPIWSLVILAFNIAVIWALSTLLARGN
ncbi:hypothetical protein [Promicromonospora sp. MEB111]|uniref:DUF7144 family membrane protein n=1 Tax=unclassified Promicromonospora TaxID=2647929 RepID=UPI002549E202|nr:hypothetical protein [Promicromonospora sp. MEB111]